MLRIKYFADGVEKEHNRGNMSRYLTTDCLSRNEDNELRSGCFK